MARPTGLIATKGIELLTWSTPNGYKASILLEELKEAYGLEYTYQPIDISTGVQKEPWFTAVNPNGRIPAIVDHDHAGGFPVFEGNAILSYLTRKYDPKNLLSFAIDDDDYTRAEAWIGWQHGGVGPMQGQANHFLRAAKERIPWGIQRYVGETERLYGILDAHLANRDYIVGPGKGRFSIADISLLGWVNGSPNATLERIVKDQFVNLWGWFQRCVERPAVKRGFNVPPGPPRGLLAGEGGSQDEKARKVTEDLVEVVKKAKEQYGYKYSSP